MQTIDLNGAWSVEYDSQTQEIQIPCAVETIMENKDFYGPFLFCKIFTLDKISRKNTYSLVFEGVSYYCEVILNGQKIGEHEGVWDSFTIEADQAVQPGENRLEVRVMKPDFDKNSPYFFRSVLFGFIPDIMLPFGGIWKGVSLKVREYGAIQKLTPMFRMENRAIELEANFSKGLHEGAAAGADQWSVEAVVENPDHSRSTVRLSCRNKLSIPVADVKPWSPEQPNVYRCTVTLYYNGTVCDTRVFTGGFRNIRIEDGEILLNGNPFYMRGALHWGCYPDRMLPVPTYEEVKKELLGLKELGFNTVKHCLYFPPDYYYELCDELGIVTWQELPLWLPFENEFLTGRIYRQYPKMLDYFMQYPTVTIVSLGCELDATVPDTALNDLYRMVKEREAQMILCDNSGSAECFDGACGAKSDIYDYHFYPELPGFNALLHEFTAGYREKKPWLFGEYNDADTFRPVVKTKYADAWWTNPDERKNLLRKVHKGFGSDQPVYRQKEILESYGVWEEIGGLEELSRRQMLDTRKYLLEMTRSFPEIKGYNITTIRDVPLTTSGIFDDEGNPKCEAGLMKRINGDVVISLQKELGRVWKNGGDRFKNTDPFNYFAGSSVKGRLVISNRSGQKLEGFVRVRLRNGDELIQEQEECCRVNRGETVQLSQISVRLPDLLSPMLYTLEAEVSGEDFCYSNSWEVWSYPRVQSNRAIYLLDDSGSFNGIESFFTVERIKDLHSIHKLSAGDILLTTRQDEKLTERLPDGVRMIVCVKGEGSIPVQYVPFYREGVKRIFSHPVTDRLKHKGYAALQFFGISTDHAFDKKEMERYAGAYKSLIRRYDARNYTVQDYLVEYQKNNRRILATTLQLDGGQGSQPADFASNPLAVWLLHCMLEYLRERVSK
ncbi:glycosyl hydrolase 2 galactose-binding domain-containing protein [Diplocloster agilis]|uniref:glycosyl hydrolase 2 galactose-binding domain-containing protein n=1 Tax=Diplocloster agilis TaxID=2850323 RepID=UPI000822F8A8|nr:sugar-binding domain-containing protein [Suonthocola fibrivorans]MCU6733305.1 hypothetical protein [Suonthocola fibrivorans]SCI86491.1 Beta-galactosidase [uncultured Clostridium sp.]